MRKPDFKLLANQKDITEKIKQNLIHLEFQDKEGVESDEISFTVFGIYAKPAFGDSLELFLGYEGGELFLCGKFSVQTTTRNYVQNTTEVRATAVNFATSQKEKKSKLWENTTLLEVARAITKQNSLSLKSEGAENISVKSEMQNEQNDIEFLYSLAFKNGFLASVKNQTFILRPKDSKTEPEAQEKREQSHLPVFSLPLTELFELEITEANRGSYDAVSVEWQDTKEGKAKILKAGGGEQIYKMRIPEPKSESEAFKQAEAKLDELKKGGVNGRLSTRGQEVRAGGKIKIKGLEGEWSIKEVSHTLDASAGTYIIEVYFEG